eukprot:15474986-Alexandrium_andersonii.AAC.1
MGEQRVAFYQQKALTKAQMEQQLSHVSQAIGEARREADKARQNEERMKRELAESKRREAEARLAIESKALEKKWSRLKATSG